MNEALIRQGIDESGHKNAVRQWQDIAEGMRKQISG
jgi:hypothetical protein